MRGPIDLNRLCETQYTLHLTQASQRDEYGRAFAFRNTVKGMVWPETHLFR